MSNGTILTMMSSNISDLQKLFTSLLLLEMRLLEVATDGSVAATVAELCSFQVRFFEQVM